MSNNSTFGDNSIYRMCRYFDIEKGKDSPFSEFSINKTIYFKTEQMSQNLYSLYETNQNDTWSGISYKVYNTIELWWIICKTNQVINPFNLPISGTKLIILNKDFIDSYIIPSLVK